MSLVFSFFIVLLLDAACAVAAELKDVKPPVDFPASHWPLLFLLVLVLGTSSLLLYYLIRKFKKKKFAVIVKTPWDLGLERLEALRKKNFPTEGKYKEFYTELSDIVRRYMEERFEIRAPEMTTQEFLWTLQNSSQLIEEQKSLLRNFLNSCDMVKFAKYGPTTKESEESFNFAHRLIEETREVSIESKTQP